MSARDKLAPAPAVYQAGLIKPGGRATAAEMEARAAFLIDYARRLRPVSVRQLYYQAEVHHLPGIDKSESSYDKIQAQVLALRRAGRIPYSHVTDGTRWMRRPNTYDGLADLQAEMAQFYRRSLWAEQPYNLEIWLEKDALAGVIYPVTSEFDVPLMVTRGYSSETFAFEAVANYVGDDRPLYIHAFYDFDRAGHDAARSLEEKVLRFGRDLGVSVHFHLTALDLQMVQDLDLPTREPKRKTPADRAWPHAIACELDAIPPDTLRQIVRNVCESYMPADELARLQAVEALERETIASLSLALPRDAGRAP